MNEDRDPVLTKEGFERLLVRASQPIREPESPPTVVKTSAPRPAAD